MSLMSWAECSDGFSAFSTVSRTSMVLVLSSLEWWKRRNGLEAASAAFFGARLATTGTVAARFGEVDMGLTLSKVDLHPTRCRWARTRTPCQGRLCCLLLALRSSERNKPERTVASAGSNQQGLTPERLGAPFVGPPLMLASLLVRLCWLERQLCSQRPPSPMPREITSFMISLVPP